jgi:hypothetical protein
MPVALPQNDDLLRAASVAVDAIRASSSLPKEIAEPLQREMSKYLIWCFQPFIFVPRKD